MLSTFLGRGLKTRALSQPSQKNNNTNEFLYTTEREDKIIDSESCVNVREWCACVNMGDRLLRMFV